MQLHYQPTNCKSLAFLINADEKNKQIVAIHIGAISLQTGISN